MGHLYYASLQLLHKIDMVIGLPKITVKDGFCELCIMGKQHREPFLKKKSWRAKEKLELVHSDIYGPMPIASLGGATYFLTFIDDFSRKVWVYPLREKSQTFTVFK